jgi:hypothetical protein
MPTENELLDWQYGPASTVCEYPLDWPYDKYLQSADAQEYKDRAAERQRQEEEEKQFP